MSNFLKMALPSDSKVLQGKSLQEVVELKMKGGILGAGKKRKVAAKNSDLEDSNQSQSPAPMQVCMFCCSQRG